MMSGCVVELTSAAEEAAVDELHPVFGKSFARVVLETETCPISVELSSTWKGVERIEGRSMDCTGRIVVGDNVNVLWLHRGEVKLSPLTKNNRFSAAGDADIVVV